MNTFKLILYVYILLQSLNEAIALKAGASKVDCTPPDGVPLAGYNHGARRVPWWPIPSLGKYTTWMTGATGRLDGIHARALVLEDAKGTKTAYLSVDAVGCSGALNDMAYDIAVTKGFTVPRGNVNFFASHSHSGPGAIAPDFLWSVAPATDLMVPELQRAMAEKFATALVEAEKAMVPAKMQIGNTDLVGVTRNRRWKESPYLNETTIDPHLGVMVVEAASGGARLATLWNFAIHGVCFGPDNLKFSGDIMGWANNYIETEAGGYAMFVNADAGDIDPARGMCDTDGMSEKGPTFKGGTLMGKAVVTEAKKLAARATDQVQIDSYSSIVEFGPTDLNATLGRWDNCTHGGPLDICSICAVLGCDAHVHLPSSWIENAPRFGAVRFNVKDGEKDQHHILVTMPGEPLLQLGWWARNATLKAGYTGTTLLAGYSNSHMGYFATPREYDIGGYESQLTFWGIETAQKVLDSAVNAMNNLGPV